MLAEPRAHLPYEGRRAALDSQRAALETEVTTLSREEAYLSRQIERAAEQVRYYERLLRDLKRDWDRRPPLRELVRQFR
jgi:predicted  nucleic acid-binding Zn-ribbon protein